MKSILVICGPTATGKTAAALELAQKIDAEIISVDSGQIYRGMDIGTAKPTADEQSQITFHLINIKNPDEIFSAADFEQLATQAIHDIHARGKRVILCGGTGLYLRALEAGVFEGPSRSDDIRKELEEEIHQEGLTALRRLHDELRSIDPQAAASIPFQNRQRLIRALEVYRLTGKPISQFWLEQETTKKKSPFLFQKFALDLPKEELNQRIEKRVDQMMEMGLAREVENLFERWGSQAPGLQMIGYKEIIGCLRENESMDLAVELIKKHTRNYAKRQLTWFRKDKKNIWVKSFLEIFPKT